MNLNQFIFVASLVTPLLCGAIAAIRAPRGFKNADFGCVAGLAFGAEIVLFSIFCGYVALA